MRQGSQWGLFEGGLHQADGREGIPGEEDGECEDEGMWNPHLGAGRPGEPVVWGETGGEAADGAHLAVGLDTQLTVLVVYFTVMVARIS